MDIIKINGVEFCHDELLKALNNGKCYMVKGRAIHHIKQVGDKFKAHKVAIAPKNCLPYTTKGCYFLTGKEHARSLAMFTASILV